MDTLSSNLEDLRPSRFLCCDVGNERTCLTELLCRIKEAPGTLWGGVSLGRWE